MAGRDGVWAPFEPETELAHAMAHRKGLQRFKTRRDAEQALFEIIEDGGRASEFRIDALPDGGFVITILERDGESVVGSLGA